MKSIKMIVSDLDNTLLRDDKTISDYTRSVLEACQKLGILFVPATARVLRKLDQMKVTSFLTYDALVACNGSKIYHRRSPIYQAGFSAKERQPILSLLLENYPHKLISVEINNCTYANYDVLTVDPSEDNFIQSNLVDLPDASTDRIILGVENEQEIFDIQQHLPAYAYIHGVSDSPIARILHENVSKANALNYLCQQWSIAPDEIVCFGDDANDLEMFAFCGTAVAVANAIESVKSIADDHTETNNQDGVAKWLATHVLKQDSY